MKDKIIDFRHILSIKKDWQKTFIEELGCVSVNNKYLYFPKEIADGSICILPVMPDVSVVIIDAVINKPIRFTRGGIDEDIWILYYDLSDETGIHIVDGIAHEIGYKSTFGFGILDSRTTSSYLSKVGNRFYALRLLVRKSYLKTFFKDVNQETSVFDDIFDDTKRTMFFYGHINSKSKVILNQFKERKMEEPCYGAFVK